MFGLVILENLSFDCRAGSTVADPSIVSQVHKKLYWIQELGDKPVEEGAVGYL